MAKKKLYFTAGQFAQVHDVNKRTLQYYDDIGLFQPQARGENNYRYYSYRQSPELELILTLREMDMSISEIADYLEHRSPQHLAELAAAKAAELAGKIARLQKMQGLLEEKEQQMRFCMEVDVDAIGVIECTEERLLLSEPVHDADGSDHQLAVLMEHIKELDEYSMFNNHYGSVTAISQAQAGNFEQYRFFSLIRDDDGSVPVFIKPAGHYLRAFCQGDWELLPGTYQRLFDYAAQRGLRLTGYAYEVGINEMAVSSMEQYITQITVRCDER